MKSCWCAGAGCSLPLHTCAAMWSEARGWRRPWGRAWSGQPSSFGAVESPSCFCAVPKCNLPHRSTHFPLPESKALQKPPQRDLGALCCYMQSLWKCGISQCLSLLLSLSQWLPVSRCWDKSDSHLNTLCTLWCRESGCRWGGCLFPTACHWNDGFWLPGKLPESNGDLLGIPGHCQRRAWPLTPLQGDSPASSSAEKINHSCSYRRQCWGQQRQRWAEHSLLRPHALGRQDSVTEAAQDAFEHPFNFTKQTLFLALQRCSDKLHFHFMFLVGTWGSWTHPSHKMLQCNQLWVKQKCQPWYTTWRRNVCFWVPGTYRGLWGHDDSQQHVNGQINALDVFSWEKAVLPTAAAGRWGFCLWGLGGCSCQPLGLPIQNQHLVIKHLTTRQVTHCLTVPH